MLQFFQVLLDEVDTDLIAKLDECQETIKSYNLGNRNFDDKSFKAFQAYKLLQDPKALEILKTTKGSTVYDECKRLLLLNQFKVVYSFMLTQNIQDQNTFNQKAIAQFWLFGYDRELHEEILRFPHHELNQLTYLSMLDNLEAINIQPSIIAMADSFCKSRLNEIGGFKAIYVRKFRIQTYYFDQLLKDTNNMLIEMNYVQMLKILVLPSDYFNQYYLAFEYTIFKLFNGKENQDYEQFLKKIKFNKPILKISNKELFLNAIHTGITRAIVNEKIQLSANYKESEWKTGILDACYILRRLPKWSQLDPIDDLVYQDLIYKLK